MSPFLQPPAPPQGLVARVRGREPVLGALIGMSRVDPAGLDLVVVDALVPLTWVPSATPAVLVRIDEVAQVGPALAAGAVGVVAPAADAAAAQAIVSAVLGRRDALVFLDGPADLESVAGVDGVLGARVRLVGSPADARGAFAGGADIVFYDVPAMLDDLVLSFPGGRPEPVVTTTRDPLVLLSGMLGDGALWDGVARRLANEVLPWPARIDLDDSVPEMAATVLAAAPRRFALAGHSLGAIVALEIMRQAPGRVTRLALINASGRGPVDAQQRAWSAWRDRTERGEFASIVRELASATLAVERRNDAELVAANAAMSATVGPAGFLRQLSAQSTRPDSLDSLSAIEVPVLVLSGGSDEICPPHLQRELADGCSWAELVTVDGGGHMLPLECPDEVAAALRAWLESQRGEVAAT